MRKAKTTQTVDGVKSTSEASSRGAETPAGSAAGQDSSHGFWKNTALTIYETRKPREEDAVLSSD